MIDYRYFAYQIFNDVINNYPLFDQFTLRQEFKDTCHKDTKCIFLRGPAGVNENTTYLSEHEKFHSMEFQDWDNRKLFPSVDRFLEVFLSKTDHTEIGWITLVTLKSQGFITPHADQGKYCEAFTRYHLPIYSTGSLFFVDGDVYNPMDGFLFTYDNQKMHTAYNPKETERIHLIFDAL